MSAALHQCFMGRSITLVYENTNTRLEDPNDNLLNAGNPNRMQFVRVPSSDVEHVSNPPFDTDDVFCSQGVVSRIGSWRTAKGRVPLVRSRCSQIRRLSNSGQLHEAITVLDLVDYRLPYDTYMCLLQACIKARALAEGNKVHAHIIKTGFRPNILFENTLVNMYAKCGDLVNAQIVFGNMPEHNIFTWTIIIAGCSQHGYFDEVISLFGQMEHHGMKPNKFTYVSVLSACANSLALEWGKFIHAHLMKAGAGFEIFVGNTIITMYAKSGSIGDAYKMFERLPVHDVVSWNVIITGYKCLGQGANSIDFFRQMQQHGFKPDRVTFLSVFAACAITVALDWGKYIHASLLKAGLDLTLSIGSSLIDMYAKCGCLEDGCKVFMSMSSQDVISWTTMISGCAFTENMHAVMKVFDEMQQQGFRPNNVTYVAILSACVNAETLEWGKFIHAHCINGGTVVDMQLNSALIDMYLKCGSTDDASRVFERIPSLGVALWNAVISGSSNCMAAIKLFNEMVQQGFYPDNITHVAVLSACMNGKVLGWGKYIHARIMRSILRPNLFVENALVAMYSRCGSLEDLHQVFVTMDSWDEISWNTMISECCEYKGNKAIKIFQQMCQLGFVSTKVTHVGLLCACANVGNLSYGKLVHTILVVNEQGLDIVTGSAIIGMYNDCGNISDACSTFDRLLMQDAISWTMIITGYANHGDGAKTLKLFAEMQKTAVNLDSSTFISVLAACSHVGLVNEGLHCFHSMMQTNKIKPTAEHYACMVDLFGRSGYLHEAKDFIDMMSCQVDEVVRMSFLGACRIHGDICLAEIVIKELLDCSLIMQTSLCFKP